MGVSSAMFLPLSYNLCANRQRSEVFSISASINSPILILSPRTQYQKVALRTGGKRIVRSLALPSTSRRNFFTLIRRLLFSNDIILRLEQALKAALLVLRRGIVLIGCSGRARARRIQEGEQQVETVYPAPDAGVCSKSSSVSPGKPTIISLDSVISGIFSRASAIRDL